MLVRLRSVDWYVLCVVMIQLCGMKLLAHVDSYANNYYATCFLHFLLIIVNGFFSQPRFGSCLEHLQG